MYLVVAVVINRHKNSPAIVSVSIMITQVKIWHSLFETTEYHLPTHSRTTQQSQRHWQVTLQSLDANTQLTSPPPILPTDSDLKPYNKEASNYKGSSHLQTVA